MPSITVRKTIAYTDTHSGASFAIATEKIKVGKHAYRQTIVCGGARRLIEIGSNPNYTKLVYACVENVGDYDATIRVSSGGGTADITLPPGRTWDTFNANHWSTGSATDPDTIDEVLAIPVTNDVVIKVDALYD